MITRFQDKTKDKLFYVPSVSGPEGKLPFADQNWGADNRIKSFKEYFGEYRKGSNQYGNLVNRLMEFLRLPEFKEHVEENDGLKFEKEDFEKRSNIKIEELQQLLNKDHNLYRFDIDVDDEYITFSNLKSSYKDRYVSGRKE